MVPRERFKLLSHKLSTWQHGFYPRRSSVTQLTQVVHLLAQSLDDKLQVDLVYLDFAKAFDRVPHAKLLYKLHLFGIRDPLLSWFRSYLTKRRHRVILQVSLRVRSLDRSYFWYILTICLM